MSNSHKEYNGFTFWKGQIYHFAPRDMHFVSRIANASTRASPRQVAKVYMVSKIQMYITPGGPCISEKLWMKRFREISCVLCVFLNNFPRFLILSGLNVRCLHFPSHVVFFWCRKTSMGECWKIAMQGREKSLLHQKLSILYQLCTFAASKIQDYTANYTLWYWSNLINWFDTGFWFHWNLILNPT